MSEASHSLSARAGLTALPPTPSARSQRTFNSTDRDFDSELGIADTISGPGAGPEAGNIGLRGGEQDEAVHFCLLAEFDIDAGATLADQYPHPTGTDEHRLAELMLPDGAHLRPEDWTVFYLGQTSHSGLSVSTTILEGDKSGGQSEITRRASMMDPADRPPKGVPGGGLLYVLNCVRMKEDKSVRRGAMVKAMAVCSPYPYIGIFKPLLLLALEEYFTSPSDDVLRRLFDACNNIPTDGLPRLSRHERILLRSSERKDLLKERYEDELHRRHQDEGDDTLSLGHRARSSSGSSVIHSVFDADRKQNEPRTHPSLPRDTHWFESRVEFRNIQVPIRIPMTTFDEDVGEYSIVELVQTFSNAVPFPGPYHPHLHTNGANTHPVMLILNAMLAHKRILFLGYGQPANNVARMVLAACAMVSGCGQVLRGMTESAFPYANLASLDILEEFGGYVAGVSNPRFEELPHTWDVLCNLETGRVTVSKELKPFNTPAHQHRAGATAGRGSEDSMIKVDDDSAPNTPAAVKGSATSRPNCTDNQFIDEILTAMSQFQGEANIRLRFTEYMKRFTSLASYQEYTHTGRTKIGRPPSVYKYGRLGSGAVFTDEVQRQREMRTNGHKIDAWRRTDSYKLFAKDWATEAKRRTTHFNFDFDLEHQVMRLRKVGRLQDDELTAIYSALAASVGSYEQVVELLTHLPQYAGGLAPIANGMLHQNPDIRNYVLDILLTINQYPVGHLIISQMNYYHGSLFFREAEKRSANARHSQEAPSPTRATYIDATPQQLSAR